MVIDSKNKFSVSLFGEENKYNDEFASLIDNKNTLFKTGNLVEGRVVRKGKDTITVDVGLKNEGIIALSEFENDDNSNPEVGNLVNVYIEKLCARNDRVVLSRKKAIKEAVWKELEKIYEDDEIVEGVIFERVKGGLAVDIRGVIAFLPGSQLDVIPIQYTESFMNDKHPLKILKMDKSIENIIVSRKKVLEKSIMESRKEILSKIEEGVILKKGKVKNITHYGVFVDLGNIDGLIHITDLSWKRINHPSEVLAVGDEVDTIVIKFDKEEQKISLGIKQIDMRPWEEVKSNYLFNEIYTGKISSITHYGILVELTKEIEGLVHISEVGWSRNNFSIKNNFSIGQDIKFKVLEICDKKYRVSLSMKQCYDNPWQILAQNNKIGDEVTGIINNVSDFGLFVTLEENVNGLVYLDDISWLNNTNSRELLASYKKGDKINCKIISFDIEKEKIGLSIRELKDNPYNKIFDNYNVGDIVDCIVKKVDNNQIIVELDELPLIIYQSELLNKYIEKKRIEINIDTTIKAKIIRLNKQENIIMLSNKQTSKQSNLSHTQQSSKSSRYGLDDILGDALAQKKIESDKFDK